MPKPVDPKSRARTDLVAHFTLLPFLLLALSACSQGDRSGNDMAPEAVMPERAQSSEGGAAMGAPMAEADDSAAQAPAGAPVAIDPAAPPADGPVPPSNLKVIKDSTMSVVVDTIESGLSRLETIAAQGGGYVVEKQTDFSDAYHRRATIKIAVRAQDFEASLERIRQAVESVEQERASGVDVSQQYVDLESEIANLEATRARIRGFMDDAESVEEALQVNAQLTSIEGEIGLRKGRLKDLADRSSFSSITLTLTELPPAITPTVTPTATATPTATPRPPWQPAGEVKEAFGVLGGVLRGIGDLAIWLTIVGLPTVLVLFLIFKALVYLLHLLRGKPGPRPPVGPSGGESGS